MITKSQYEYRKTAAGRAWYNSQPPQKKAVIDWENEQYEMANNASTPTSGQVESVLFIGAVTALLWIVAKA